MRERILDLRDATDTMDVLTAIAVDVHMPGRYDYTWESARDCLSSWDDDMVIKVLLESQASHEAMERLQDIASDLPQLTVEESIIPELNLEPDRAQLPAPTPKELERAATVAERRKARHDNNKKQKALPPPPPPPVTIPMPGRDAVGEQLERWQQSRSTPSPWVPVNTDRATSDEMRAAHLIAVNMAAKGRSRHDVQSYLDRHFELGDVSPMLDDVYDD